VNPLNSIAAPTLLSICVSKAKDVDVDGIIVSTGIFKLPVTGKVKVRRLNLNGDEQADLTVHGGPDKAVYAYPIEQYAYWKKELPNRELEWGSFGENLTVSGFTEDSVCIGDKLKIGTALFAVTQPRIPCYKLGIRLGDPSMIKRFYKSGKWGFYLSVLEEGEIETGDQISHQSSDGNGIRLSDVSHCFLDPTVDAALFARVLQSNLAQQMKDHLEYNASRRK
jgi:MOSC domain-containing protein YiiM